VMTDTTTANKRLVGAAAAMAAIVVGSRGITASMAASVVTVGVIIRATAHAAIAVTVAVDVDVTVSGRLLRFSGCDRKRVSGTGTPFVATSARLSVRRFQASGCTGSC
jgi:hypothetical protein